MKDNFKKAFQGKKILVTGGTGSIGSELVRQILKYEPAQIRIYSRDESKQFFLQQELNRIKSNIDIRFLIGDVRDKVRLDMAFGQVNIVFHAAALKHVSFCEYNPFEAIATNVTGTQNMIDLAIKHKVDKVVAISTDKAVNPANILGTTKLLMEKMILSTRWYLGMSKTKFCAVRFGNVINSRGSALPLWRSQIKNGGPVTLTDPKMTRYFMSIKDAAKLILQATKLTHGQEIFILKMPEKNVGNMAHELLEKNASKRKLPITIKITGRQAGEKLHEELFTAEEQQSLFELEKMYVVIPYTDTFRKRTKQMYSA